ncbi:nucleoside diphosphate kinase regulator [Nordella sp. HKS 07]|uniref:nucleoside diphosphate kinase regulator n=1 Tax=Nordella sp. HKS 07 TaxID=2712222 RepID=UPI0013E111CE|nr:nucleoside diphosphate kinase regulator [Nordella sp. HKS 07]QIG51375.1 nucleoside diphosphate kinase regulator [Nordella sp. HKS 07]
MNDVTPIRRKPEISITATDHTRLMTLANAIAERDELLAEDLFGELERAKVVADGTLTEGVIRMGSQVSFKDDKGVERSVALVFPTEADFAQGRLSILTPVGTALIGLSAGQSILWTARDGQKHELTVLEVKS